jgi:hypothetical protein
MVASDPETAEFRIDCCAFAAMADPMNAPIMIVSILKRFISALHAIFLELL